MRRIFTSMFLMLACVAMSAQTVLFEGSQQLDWNEGVKIAASEFELAEPGDVVTITTQGGGCKVNLQAPWTTVAETDTETTLYTISDGDLTNLLAGGLQIQGSSTLLKVEANFSGTEEPEEPAGPETVIATLFDGSHALGVWANTLEIDGALLTAAGAQPGDYLYLEYALEAGSGDGWQIQLCMNSPEWTAFFPCEDLDEDDDMLEVELNDYLLPGIEADKLYIQGKNLIIKKVEIHRPVTDGISNVSTDIAGKKQDGCAYSLDGRKLNPNALHGIYIMNGKKYLAK